MLLLNPKCKFKCLNLFFTKLFHFYLTKDLMQGKLFQKCTYLFYCSVLSLGGNVNTRRMSKPDIGSIFHIKNQWNILVIGKNYFQYVRRVYATAINFPCISTLYLISGKGHAWLPACSSPRFLQEHQAKYIMCQNFAVLWPHFFRP